MTRISLCGRRLNISDDDFLCPSVASALWRIMWIVTVAALLGVQTVIVNSDPCWNLVEAFLIVSLVLSVLGLALDNYIAWYTSAGTIVDNRLRAFVPAAVTLRLVGAIVDAAIGGLGVLATAIGPFRCPALNQNQPLATVLLIAASIGLGVAGSIFLSMGVLWVCGFAAAEHRLSAEEALKESAHGWARCCRVCSRSCANGTTDDTVYDEVGVVVAGVLQGVEMLGLATSDVLAGLALVRVLQKEEERQQVRAIAAEQGAAAELRRAETTIRGGGGAGGGGAVDSRPAVAAPVGAPATPPTTAAAATSTTTTASTGPPAASISITSDASPPLRPRAGYLGTLVRTAAALPRWPWGSVQAMEQRSRVAQAAAVAAHRARAARHRLIAERLTQTVAFDADDPLQLRVIDEAAHYSSFAVGAYGWMLMAYMNLCT